MNLKDQAGFVTIHGYDKVIENSNEVGEASSHVNEAENAAFTESEEVSNRSDRDESAPARIATTASSDTQDTHSRSDSVDLDHVSEDECGLVPQDTDFVQSTPWTPQSREQSVNELHDYFHQFYSIRRVVKQTYKELKQACLEIQDLLAASSIGDSLVDKGTETWLSSGEEQTIMNVLGTDPILMVLGGKGSGKSSVINGILDADILPTSSAMLKHACNGIVHLKYDSEGYVKIARSATVRRLTESQPQQEQQAPKPSQQVREFIEESMSDDERTAWGALDNCILEIGVRNPILRTRVQFLEIPGDCFDPRLRERLLRQLLVSKHQTVMYIIDGNKGLGNSDREFLFFLKANMPNMRIFFIVNKVDYDPEAEEMDCESDNEDYDGADEFSSSDRFHESGVQTQKRKLKLVTDQLEKYKLATAGPDGRPSVFPVSVLRQKCSLAGTSDKIARLNQEYKATYQTMVTALKDCLVETGRSRMELALSTLFLVAVRTFDAFTRDPGDKAGEGASQAEQASKDRIVSSFRQTKQKFKECKVSFLEELKEIHGRGEEFIVGECRRLEFGPLRLYHRIRNNEVEEQYREQINNYVLHLLNIQIQESLNRRIEELKSDLFNEVEKLKQQFSRDSREHPSSPWEDLIRTHADEIIMNIVKLNFSVEWKAEAGFLKWVKKLLSGSAGSRAKPISPNTPEWKSEVAKEFYASIDLSAVVRKVFAGVDCTIKQAESGLLNLVNSRHKFAAKLQKMLAKDNADALSVWHRVQFCLVSAEGLRNLQARGTLDTCWLTEPVTATCLGKQYHLSREYAGFDSTKKSGVAITVTGISDAESNAEASWINRLGGIPNHHLVKGRTMQRQSFVAITRMVTFTDKYELCVLHSAYRASLKDYIDRERYSKAQCFQTIRDLMQIWHFFSQHKESLPWSLTLDNLKVSAVEGATVVYDCLENPLPSLRKGHTFSERLFAKSEAETRSDKQAEEFNNLLQLTFMLLVRSSRGFKPDELARISERELAEDRHRDFKKYLTGLAASCRELDQFPADTIADMWYTKPEHKVASFEKWLDRGLQKSQQK